MIGLVPLEWQAGEVHNASVRLWLQAETAAKRVRISKVRLRWMVAELYGNTSRMRTRGVPRVLMEFVSLGVAQCSHGSSHILVRS